MTPQEAKKEFDKLKDFKAQFLFWVEHKNLIQESFTDLQNELNELIGKEDQESGFRRGNIFRELEAIKPLPKSEEDKAFVVEFMVENKRKDLEKDSFPIFSFDRFKENFKKESENRDKNILINYQLELVNNFLSKESNFYCSKVFIDKKLEINLDKYIYKNLDNNCTIDLSVFYDNVVEGWHISANILAKILSPIQYKRFLEKEKESVLQNRKPASSKPKISDNDFNLGYTDMQLETLHGKLTNTKELETDLTEDQTIIYNYIKHLKGDNSNRERIMTTENFNLLFKDLCYLVKKGSLPEITKSLPQMGVSNQSIIYTVRLIHKEIFTTTKIKPSFIEFLQKYFQQLSNMENMKVAFSKKMPKKYPY